MQISFFTDDYADQLLPLTLTRPVDDLRVGILTIREKWLAKLKCSSFSRICDNYLAAVFPTEKLDETSETLWINSRFLPSDDLLSEIENLTPGETLSHSGSVVAAVSDREFTVQKEAAVTIRFPEFKSLETSASFSEIRFLYDLLAFNEAEIEKDIEIIKERGATFKEVPDKVFSSTTENIFLSEGAEIEAGCIIVADHGPVYIGPGALIEAGSILKGPVAICEKATVKMAARISDSTTVGPMCKIGGEVKNSIFHSYSNKAHDGFAGNSILGQWCNLGADTNTSNLKNNYSKVTFSDWKTKTPMGEGVQFLGTVMGDHSKTSINTMLNTGTVCGVSSNIFCSGFPPKYIPSFKWVGDKGSEDYVFDKAVDSMRAMMKRREIELTKEYLEMMKIIYES